MSSLRYLIVGAGAVGGYFGGRMAEAGRDVTFLVRPARAAALRANGLELRSPLGDARLKPRLLVSGEAAPDGTRFDVIVIATKAYSLTAAMNDIQPYVSDSTYVLPLLNGMLQLDTLGDRFGVARVLGGSVRIIGDLDEAGRVVQMTELGEISYGALPATRISSEMLQQIDADMRVPNVTAILQPDITATLWQKWSIVASMGIVCLLGGGSLGEVASAPRGLSIADAVLDECLATAEANGYAPNAQVFRTHRARLHDTHSTLTSSLYRDMTRGLPVEADHLVGDLVARAEGKADVPLLTAAYVRLKVYEAQQHRAQP